MVISGNYLVLIEIARKARYFKIIDARVYRKGYDASLGSVKVKINNSFIGDAISLNMRGSQPISINMKELDISNPYLSKIGGKIELRHNIPNTKQVENKEDDNE